MVKFNIFFEVGINLNEIEYKLITEYANDLIRVYNEKFDLLYVNELIHTKLLGYSKEDLVGKSRGKLLHPEEYKEIGKNWRKFTGREDATQRWSLDLV